jgi:DNA-binding MarR family transcriptional regulator
MPDRVRTRQHAGNRDARAGGPRTAAGEALSELVVHVFRLDGLLTAAGDALAGPTGQTTARWRVLAAVERAPMTVAQIARAWGLARQSVQRVADALERERLVTLVANPHHRRAKLVRLTPKGRTALGRIQHAQRAWANALGERVGEAELRVANTALAHVTRAVADGRTATRPRSRERSA